MPKRILKPSAALFPVPVVLVTCQGKEGKPNIITIAWAGVVCSEPPMISISVRPGRHSHGLIKESGEFVVNIPSAAMLRTTDFCGTVSGRKVDKFKEARLTPLPANKVRAPLIKECPVNLECQVHHSMLLGTHEIFIGEVVALHADGEVLEGNAIDMGKVNPLAYGAPEHDYWSIKEKVGTYGFSKGRIEEISE